MSQRMQSSGRIVSEDDAQRLGLKPVRRGFFVAKMEVKNVATILHLRPDVQFHSERWPYAMDTVTRIWHIVEPCVEEEEVAVSTVS